MLYPIANILLLYTLYATICDGWKAVPANQAMYALRSTGVGFDGLADEPLPNTELNNIYKFGWCPPDVISKHYLRKTINFTISTWQESHLSYFYLLERKHSQRYVLQCIVMKMYVSRKLQFVKSRLPLYYCQGLVHILMMNTIQRLEIHEFYLHNRLNIPASFVLEMYHPPLL